MELHDQSAQKTSLKLFRKYCFNFVLVLELQGFVQYNFTYDKKQSHPTPPKFLNSFEIITIPYYEKKLYRRNDNKSANIENCMVLSKQRLL